MGASLAKIAVRDGQGRLSLHLLPSADPDAVAAEVLAAGAETVGVTGGGAPEVEARLRDVPLRVNEFAAWGAGVRVLLRNSALDVKEPFLLVSVGTGTSVMHVDGMAISRVGGTALGGGTVLGLGSLLIGCGSFAELCDMAARGSRQRVDLLVSDIYGPGEIPLAGDLTAANFGRMARPGLERPAPEDLAAGIMAMVGENVALVTGGLAGTHRLKRVVYAGSTLRGNRVLTEVLTTITTLLGNRPTVLADGEFAGAVGALELAAAPRPRRSR